MKLSNKTGATSETRWPVEFMSWPSWQLTDIKLFIIQVRAHTRSLVRTPRGKQKAADTQVVNKSSSCCLSKSIKPHRCKALWSDYRIRKSKDDGENSKVGLKKVILQSLLRVLSLSNKLKDWRKEGPTRVEAVSAPQAYIPRLCSGPCSSAADLTAPALSAKKRSASSWSVKV